MPTYSADQIIGKTLTARRTLVAYDLPTYMANSQKIGTIKIGQSAGVVYSYVGGTPGKPLFWQFKGNNGKDYYIVHQEGAFDVQSLKDQGALTTAEAATKAEEADMSFKDRLAEYFKKSGKIVLYGGLAILALNVILKNTKK